jgi:hypothetical protein
MTSASVSTRSSPRVGDGERRPPGWDPGRDSCCPGGWRAAGSAWFGLTDTGRRHRGGSSMPRDDAVDHRALRGVEGIGHVLKSSRMGRSSRVTTVRQVAVACSTSSSISLARVRDKRYIYAVCRQRSMRALGSPSVSMRVLSTLGRRVRVEVEGRRQGPSGWFAREAVVARWSSVLATSTENTRPPRTQGHREHTAPKQPLTVVSGTDYHVWMVSATSR